MRDRFLAIAAPMFINALDDGKELERFLHCAECEARLGGRLRFKRYQPKKHYNKSFPLRPPRALRIGNWWLKVVRPNLKSEYDHSAGV
jgi:hypothetical protein